MKKHRTTRWIVFSVLCFIICSFIGYTLLNHLYNPADAVAEYVSPEIKTLNYTDGAIYTGEVLEGRIRNGTGTMTWITGESYEGTWVEGDMSGSGKMTWPGLGTYEGEFINSKRQGHGIFTWAYEEEPQAGDPISFDGDWNNDKIGAYGKLILAGIGTYEGSFSRQVRSGEGTFTWLNSDVYFGNWQNDAITGEGMLTIHEDGTVLKGSFQNGVLQKGTITYHINKGMAERQVYNGKLDAGVIATYNDGTIVEGKLKGNTYVGNVTITYGQSGDVYVGGITDGVKSGKGTYTWKNGAHYVGSWSDDLMSGQGTYYYGKNEKNNYLKGNFANGYPEGVLIYVSAENLKYKTTWKNGSCTDIVYTR